jgi:lipoyl(octanoyl) transferase
LNVITDLRNFELIVPCGIKDHAVTSLALEMGRSVQVPALESVAHHVARQFGMVFGEHVLAVGNLQALRAHAASPIGEFPAQDTPLRVPAEVERLRGMREGPIRA